MELTEHEVHGLARVIADDEPLQIVKLTLERRDSLDMPHANGFLIAETTLRDGERYRVAIGETGSITLWPRSPLTPEYPEDQM